MPACARQRSASALSSVRSEPNWLMSVRASSTAEQPRLPEPSRSASSSASESACGPRSSSFSRGRSAPGQWRMLITFSSKRCDISLRKAARGGRGAESAPIGAISHSWPAAFTLREARCDNRGERRRAPMQGKHILLGVTGGIAAYKAPDLVRRLRERGAEVQVVMTHGAREFVTPTTFQAVSGRTVRSDLWDAAAEAAMGHIELARWAEAVLIAPASADFLARLAAGLADDLLATLCLATQAPIAVAPAMNHLMWSNPATRANIATLSARGVQVFGPGVGDQACGESGEGRMLEPLELTERLGAVLEPAGGALAGKRVLITAGPTRERIDPVRF